MPRPGRELEAATRSHERVSNIIEDSAIPAGFEKLRLPAPVEIVALRAL
jgi:hypothetical protein